MFFHVFPQIVKPIRRCFIWKDDRGQFLRPQRSGELYVCVGGGPAATASTGFMIGFVGMLRLHETAQKKTRSQFLLGQNI